MEGRFWSKVEKTGTCWLWSAGLDTKGYGMFKLEGKRIRAHRIAHELVKGKIPVGYQIDHLCRVKRCVNPQHLEAVTPGENTRRAWATGDIVPWQSKKTHCPKGHEYNAKNTYHPPKRPSHRHCKACRIARDELLKRRRRGLLLEA